MALQLNYTEKRTSGIVCMGKRAILSVSCSFSADYSQQFFRVAKAISRWCTGDTHIQKIKWKIYLVLTNKQTNKQTKRPKLQLLRTGRSVSNIAVAVNDKKSNALMNGRLRWVRVNIVVVESKQYYTFWVRVCSLSYPARNAHASYCLHLWPAPLYNIFHIIS